MSDLSLKYVLGSARYANADNLIGNVKLSLPSTNRTIPEDQVIELVSLVQRYDRERQASPTHRIYGRLGFLSTNELLNYNSSTLILSDSTAKIPNYNLQLTYPSSHTTDISLKDFSCDNYPFLCSQYDNNTDCDNHKIYHGLPFINSTIVSYNGRPTTVVKTYNHKHGNNIYPDDYVYIIPSTGGVLNPLYGIVKVNDTLLADGTPNVLILDNNFTGSCVGSYKKIVDVSDNDIKFLNTFKCRLYVTSTTINELFVLSSEKHNAIVGDYIDLRNSGSTYNSYNGIHKVNRIVSDFLYTCDFPNHLITPKPSPAIYVPDVTYFNSDTFDFKYRVLDGNPSEYYLRKFKVMTAGDNTTTINGMEYNIQELHLSNTIWKSVTPPQFFSCNTEKQSGSDDDIICSYLFNCDVDISSYRDNLNRPLTELYLGVIKRKNSEFNTLTTNFQGSLMYSGITTMNKPLNLPLLTNPDIKTSLDYFGLQQFNDAGLNEGGEYYGDLCEYSINTLEEISLDPLQFRIGKIIGGIHVEGYVYEPFKKIQLRYLATDIEHVSNDISVYPNYAVPYRTGYIWKEISPYGFKEITRTGVKSVDSPFVNGAHYDFYDTNIYLRRQNKNPETKITIRHYASC